MALVLCFHFQLGELRGLNMSVVSERTSSQSCSVSPSCNCLFIVYSITSIWCVFQHAEENTVHICKSLFLLFNVTFSGKKCSPREPCEPNGEMNVWVCLCGCALILMTVSSCVPGQHRSLGPSISKVRSLKLDSSVWSNELVEVNVMCVTPVFT